MFGTIALRPLRPPLRPPERRGGDADTFELVERGRTLAKLVRLRSRLRFGIFCMIAIQKV